jgi:hypothetical protein
MPKPIAFRPNIHINDTSGRIAHPKAKHDNPYLRQAIDALLGAFIQLQKKGICPMQDDLVLRTC